MQDLITIKRTDLEDLEKCLTYLKDKVETLEEQLVPHTISFDVTTIKEKIEMEILEAEEKEAARIAKIEELQELDNDNIHQ